MASSGSWRESVPNTATHLFDLVLNIGGYGTNSRQSYSDSCDGEEHSSGVFEAIEAMLVVARMTSFTSVGCLVTRGGDHHHYSSLPFMQSDPVLTSTMDSNVENADVQLHFTQISMSALRRGPGLQQVSACQGRLTEVHPPR